MRNSYLALTVLLTIAGAASAEVIPHYVRVSPDNMNRWVVAQHNGGCAVTLAQFLNWPNFMPNAILCQPADPAAPPPPLGTGAFYAETGYVCDPYQDLGKVHLGTNRFTGVKLKNITKLQVTYFTHLQGPSPNVNDPPASGALLGKYVSQPFQIQLPYMIDEGLNWRCHMYRPWGVDPVTHKGEEQRPSNYSRWKTYDAVQSGVWYDAYRADFVDTWANSKFDASDPQKPDEYRYRTATLTTPDTGWTYAVYPPQYGTGCSLNLVVGPGRVNDPQFFYTWWPEAYLFRGYVDSIVIGIRDEVSGNIDEWTFDFERMTYDTVGMPLKSTRDSIIDEARHRFPVVLWGKVLNDENFTSTTFALQDGSSDSLVKVVCPEGHVVWYDYYVRAKGVYNNSVSPPVLFCLPDDIDIIAGPI